MKELSRVVGRDAFHGVPDRDPRFSRNPNARNFGTPWKLSLPEFEVFTIFDFGAFWCLLVPFGSLGVGAYRFSYRFHTGFGQYRQELGKLIAKRQGMPWCEGLVAEDLWNWFSVWNVLTLKTLMVALCVVRLTVPADAADFTKGREIAPLPAEFKPGDYVWKPEVSPAGPVVVIVSIPEQSMFVYRNGVRIGRSTVSTGAEGHATPTGIFTIKQKKVDHESSLYKGAKMPYMQRLTWDGIAMHAGRLPGYPASHGCVRLPVDFAEKLYSVTTEGTTVIVTDQKHAPGKTANPGLLLSGKTGEASAGRLPASGFEWQPMKSTNGPVSVIFSLPDSVAYVYRDGVQIGRTAFALDRKKLAIRGSHIYSALVRVDAKGRRDWLATTSIGGGKAPNMKSLAAATTIPAEFLGKVRPIIVPGTTLILTDLPVSSQTRTEQNFRILTTEAAQ